MSFLLFFLSLQSLGYSQLSNKELIRLDPLTFFTTKEANLKINIDQPDNYLVAVSIFQATNLIRKNNHLPTFLPDRSLHLAGLGHAREMTMNHFFDHVHPYKESVKTPHKRIRKNGGIFSTTAENIALIPLFKNYKHSRFIYKYQQGKIIYYDLRNRPLEMMTYGELGKELVRQWYNSRGHRKNLLAHDLTHLGVASIIKRNLNKPSKLPEIYAVQNFGAN